MIGPVFVDTNILVYARDASENVKQPVAEKWIRELWLTQRGRTSFQVLNEFYTIVTRKLDPGLTPEAAWRDVSALFAWEPQKIERDMMLLARDIERRYSLSWWDALIVAAARFQDCPLLLSEDLQEGMVFETTTIVNPFTTNVAEARASYAVTSPKPQSRHRRRGRPARAE